jgi:peptide/nickel transport system permease protein
VRQFVIRRLLQSALLLWLIMTLSFVLVRLTPGGPEAALLNQEGIEAADIERMRERFGLNDPLPLAYAKWLGSAARLDFGRSYHYLRPPLDLIRERLGATLQLGATAWLIGMLGIPLGALAATFRGRPPDVAIRVLTVVGDATPNWWMALVIIVVLANTVGWFPQGQGRGGPGPWLAHIIVPAAILGLGIMVAFARFTRSQVLEVLGQDHVLTARAKGLTEPAVANRHVLRNALTPAVTLFGGLLPVLISGAAITEGIFNWPGTGRLFLEAAHTRDYPLLLAIITVLSVATLLGTLLADIAYGLVDPRVRYS